MTAHQMFNRVMKHIGNNTAIGPVFESLQAISFAEAFFAALVAYSNREIKNDVKIDLVDILWVSSEETTEEEVHRVKERLLPQLFPNKSERKQAEKEINEVIKYLLQLKKLKQTSLPARRSRL